MIKDLIKDISYDNISLTQALTRSKLIANKTKNDFFKNWLKKELEGYNFDDLVLPQYRKIRCVIYLEMELPFGRFHTFPYSLSREQMIENKEFADKIHFHRAVEAISIIERNLASLKTQKGEIPLPPEFTEVLGSQYKSQIEANNGVLRRSYKEIHKVEFEKIIELTKQKLLDTLIELDNEFPNLINEFNITKDNTDKVQNIITTNIYGNNNPLSIASGLHVEQREIMNSITLEDYKQLEILGVEKKDVDVLKQIIEAKDDNIKDKILKWLTDISATMIKKGIYYAIPKVIEYLEKILPVIKV